MKEFVQRIIKLRENMLRRGVSRKNEMGATKALKQFKLWFEFYPNPKEENLKRYCKKHLGKLQLIMPGVGHPEYLNLKKELSQLLEI